MSAAMRVETSGGCYDIRVGTNELGHIGTVATEVLRGSRVALVSDETVGALYADSVADSLETAGFAHERILVAPGESSKSWAVAGQLVERMAASGLDRDDAVIALGGGVVGDLAGFCAGVYMRGIAVIQVPTTLLAQVDSSIGGKTAVDLVAGKNLAGAFVQPSAVLADTSTLASLSEHEWRSGLAEVVKSAILEGEEFLGWLEDHAANLVARESDIVTEAVRRCAVFKGSVVSADEREAGERESLNYGHTLGHAIEKVAGYGAIPHGIAVAEGLRFAARLSERIVGSDPRFTARQEALLDAVGLVSLRRGFNADEIRSAMSSDKKARAGTPRFVLMGQPGSFQVVEVDDSTLREEIELWLAEGDEGS